MDKVKYWIVPSNNERFRLDDLLQKYNSVFWRARNDFKVGDVVYIYATAPICCIMYEMKVVRINVSKPNYDDTIYRGPEFILEKKAPYKMVEFQFVRKFPKSKSLSYTELKNHGLKGRIQSNRTADGLLLEHIRQSIEGFAMNQKQEWKEYNTVDYEALENPDTIYEGAKKTIVVNSYERDRNAREMCIKAHGSRCTVCGLDFEKMYGEIGKGFIHVHHKIPIATIGKEYKLDPVNDLVPVCPNCHAMLHRHGNQEVLSVEELRDMVNRKGLIQISSPKQHPK